MGNDRFLILKNIKIFILGLEKLLINFPKNDILSREFMYKSCLQLLEIICLANYEKDKSKKKEYQISGLAKINVIDFYLERAYKFKYISEKQLAGKTNELLVINKMLYSWCNNE